MTRSVVDAAGEYEYGVLYESAQDAPHREGMTREEAVGWLNDWTAMGANPAAVSLIRRWKEPWERVR